MSTLCILQVQKNVAFLTMIVSIMTHVTIHTDHLLSIYMPKVTALGPLYAVCHFITLTTAHLGKYDHYHHFPDEENKTQSQDHVQGFLDGEDEAWIRFHICLFLPLLLCISFCYCILPLIYSFR